MREGENDGITVEALWATLVGHANLSMTGRYARVSISRMKATYNSAKPYGGGVALGFWFGR